MDSLSKMISKEVILWSFSVTCFLKKMMILTNDCMDLLLITSTSYPCMHCSLIILILI
ncbi:hypothetical protein Hanom_Chr01g00023391 [Helianthus anomalus]